jgi:ribonuclease R
MHQLNPEPLHQLLDFLVVSFYAIFQMNEDAEVKLYWLGRTFIHSDKRYAYEDVQTIIDTKEGENVEDIY